MFMNEWVECLIDDTEKKHVFCVRRVYKDTLCKKKIMSLWLDLLYIAIVV